VKEIIMDELAKLYFKLDGQTYRVKVFDNSLWIEVQPGGENRVFERSEWPVWNAENQAWDIGALMALVAAYKKGEVK
jgi:hypothetical protein